MCDFLFISYYCMKYEIKLSFLMHFLWRHIHISLQIFKSIFESIKNLWSSGFPFLEGFHLLCLIMLFVGNMANALVLTIITLIYSLLYNILLHITDLDISNFYISPQQGRAKAHDFYISGRLFVRILLFLITIVWLVVVKSI